MALLNEQEVKIKEQPISVAVSNFPETNQAVVGLDGSENFYAQLDNGGSWTTFDEAKIADIAQNEKVTLSHFSFLGEFPDDRYEVYITRGDVNFTSSFPEASGSKILFMCVFKGIFQTVINISSTFDAVSSLDRELKIYVKNIDKSGFTSEDYTVFLNYKVE